MPDIFDEDELVNDDILFDHDDDDDYDDEPDGQYIHDYSVRADEIARTPEEFFRRLPSQGPHTANTLYMGAELEVECRDSRPRTVAAAVLRAFPKRFAFCKQDGSLNYGFEIVTMPATFEYHQQVWPAFFDKFDTRELASSPGTTGMHIHLSRDAFSPLTLGKFLVFYNHPNNQNFIVGVSDRPSLDRLNQWAHLNSTVKVTDPIAGRTCRVPNGKYSAVNCVNSTTIEVRIFAGRPRLKSVMKNLEFTRATYEFIKAAKISQMGYRDFLHWMEQRDNYCRFPTLHTWLVEHHYITAPPPRPQRPITTETTAILPEL